MWAPRRRHGRTASLDGADVADDGWCRQRLVADRSSRPCGDGDRYGFRLDGPTRSGPTRGPGGNPTACTEPSAAFDPAGTPWTDIAWTGRQLPGGVIYELHVGTFTPRARSTPRSTSSTTWCDLGVDCVELLPVNAFNGMHNWGYDGVLWYAVHEAYGGPAAYQRFVDACHARGLAVIQDVVYNHLGPSGNYLPEFGPYLSRRPGQHLGRLGQPRRTGLRRGAPLHHRQRPDVAARLPRRRAAAGRGARSRRTAARCTCWRTLAAEVDGGRAASGPAAVASSPSRT